VGRTLLVLTVTSSASRWCSTTPTTPAAPAHRAPDSGADSRDRGGGVRTVDSDSAFGAAIARVSPRRT
jgi:hypothetical protein